VGGASNLHRVKNYLGEFIVCYAKDNEHTPMQKPNRTMLGNLVVFFTACLTGPP
jgi:hypothetical protein